MYVSTHLRLWGALEKNKILHRSEVINALLDIFSSAVSMIYICGNSKFPLQLLSLEIIKQTILSTANKNNRVKQRYLFEITRDNIQYCRNLMQIVGHDNYFCHSGDIEANFVVNEKEYLGSITLREPQQQAIYSNMSGILEQHRSIFDTLWNKAIPAKQRIEEIQEEIEPEFYEVINNYEKAQEKYIDLAKSIDKEGLLLFANSKAMIRANKIGVIDSLIEASTKKGAIIRIVCPLAEENSEIVKTISERAPDIRILDYDSNVSSHSGLFIVDRAKLMRFELKEPKAEQFSDAIGFIIFSNNKASVDSSKSLFELLWNERIQQEKLKEYDKLKEADKMKTEFINVAAHELRSPIQPVLGLSEFLLNQVGNIEQYRDLLNAINRNAKRLQQLTENILDVSKIESHTLELHKEKVNINEKIRKVINDVNCQIHNSDKLKIVFLEPENSVYVEGDEIRLYQTIANLLTNAIKFTKEGTISISAGLKHNTNELIISVSDSGEGIHPVIMPRLFTKFATKSNMGTGLGLFISRNIIEAHGGRIWAENNADRKGATFSFSLPLSVKE
ncbi:MAG TPA: HAMP domain-containing sensor histidine kinase [Nitrososphaeraceae archaeon]|nr:HAMP domain-containing sensor histidine kinase [Nitrososphaeraceae archaeon]